MNKLARLRRWTRSTRAEPSSTPAEGAPRRSPTLSVVVPVYNVEQYLAACLDSLLAQPYDDLEVVMVDDGSTDTSARIAEQYVDRDPRLRLVSQANAGLGAARNAGVRAARGRYLAFLDSDDLLPADAYSEMVRTLEASGSAFAIGKLMRDEGGRRSTMPRMRENHRVRRVGVTLDEMPRILADVFAVNKVFRRSFWDAAGLEFPVEIRYEDQPTLTRAFLAADTFDVLRETVYLWRIREDRSSITQLRHQLADLEDRITTKRTSTQMLVDKAPHLLDLWLSDILPVDMWEYFRAAPEATEEYWNMLRSAMAELWSEETVPFDRTWVPVQQRYMGWLVTEDRRDDLADLIAFVDARRGDLPVEVRADQVVALLPGVDDPAVSLPESVYVLADHELRWEARVSRATWSDGRLHLAGFALIRNVPTAGHATVLTARLERADAHRPDDPGPTAVDVEVRPVAQPRATRFAGRASQNFDDCGFEATVDVAALARSLTPAPARDRGHLDADPAPSTWRLALHRQVEQVRRGGPVTGLDREGVDLDWHGLDEDGSRARLRAVDDALVLEIARTSPDPA